MGRRRKRNKLRPSKRKKVSVPEQAAFPPQQERAKNDSNRATGHWLRPIAISAIGALLASAVIIATPLYSSNLQLTLHPPHLAWPDSEITPGGARNHFKAWFCVRNEGLKIATVSRAVVRPVGIDVAPIGKILTLDHSRIWPFATRMLSLEFILEQSVQTIPEDTQVAIDLFDDTDTMIGSLVFYGWYEGDQKSVESWINASPTAKARLKESIAPPGENICSGPERPAAPGTSGHPRDSGGEDAA